MSSRPSEADVLRWLDELSNWGRWGAEDLLGTLNYISPAVRAAAATLVREGISVSCALPIDYDHVDGDPTFKPTGEGRWFQQPSHYMLTSGDGCTPADELRRSIDDVVTMTIHGMLTTHLDAPCHTLLRGTMFNGVPASRVTTAHGALDGAVTLAAAGIVGRGVLLDVARHEQVAFLQPGDAITPEQLDACARAQGVEVRTGDILVVRTGYRRSVPRGPASTWTSWPGLQAACLPWLHAKEIAVLATDAGIEVWPHGYTRPGPPVHSVGMWAMGLWIVDNWYAEHLAQACATLERWEFQAVIAPLRLSFATGSPVNPIALL